MSDLIKKLTSLGQSLWYDNIQRKLLENGELKAMIERGDIRGVTSNPTIFQNAIAKTNDYDAALIPLAWSGWDAEKIFWQLAIEDIQEGCDLFRPLYDETKGGDGYVSLEVSPYLANDTEGTGKQAKELWERVNRPNLMVKIPATREGIPAIRKSIAAGININVTLIFSLERYAEVMDAYLSGLEDRVAANEPINMIASVASFFVSRVDTKIDRNFQKIQACSARLRLQMQNLPIMPLKKHLPLLVSPRSRLASALVRSVRFGLRRARRIPPTPILFMSIISSAPIPSTLFRPLRSMPSAIMATPPSPSRADWTNQKHKLPNLNPLVFP